MFVALQTNFSIFLLPNQRENIAIFAVRYTWGDIGGQKGYCQNDFKASLRFPYLCQAANCLGSTNSYQAMTPMG